MDQMNLTAWIDRGTSEAGGLTLQATAEAHAVLGHGVQSAPQSGAELPPLWHWFAFSPTVAMDQLGADGHPRLGDFMPPLKLKRRMWAGGNLEFIKPLRVDEALTRKTRIADISEKSGGAGDFVVVSLDHEIHGDNGLAVKERQNIVYLELPDSYQPPKAIPAPAQADVAEDVAVSNPLLFRYSAITFNAHRIHYDLPYAQGVEHYPHLVVHGPLQANLLMDLAIRHKGAVPAKFSYRGVHPLFADNTLAIQATQTSQAEWALCTVANGSHQCMQAKAIWED